jgi:hypothetical protein
MYDTVGSITNDTRKKRTVLFTTVCKLREREGENVLSFQEDEEE